MDITTNHIAALLRAIAIQLDAASDELCRLDGQIGDGDHGTTMALGFETITQTLIDVDFSTIAIPELLNLCADCFLDAVGATTGPLYASAFQGAGRRVQSLSTLSPDDSVLLIVGMSEGIAARGAAQPGDKTMMDVWFPVAHHILLSRQIGTEFSELLAEIRTIVKESVATTKTMVASKGRAARLGERSLGHIDPGASSAAIIILCFCDFFERLIAQ